MRYIFLTLTLVLLNCSRSEQTNNSTSEHLVDTVYASSFYGTPTFERYVVQMTDTTGTQNIDFQIGKTDFLKVTIPRFEEYPIFIDSTVNVTLGRTDSINGIFELTPLDTTFSIRLMQNYGTGNVVLKHSKTDSGFSVMPLNGYQEAFYRTFKIKN
ncbi:hypothetical protein AAOE16_00095 [Ekhidna sp. MALMAid0563]|uniref:hypothetical protein n=1 Tax=Ekhidna sp. MALMAid0563 TaxID=3143937 RepID=UPI0032E0139E